MKLQLNLSVLIQGVAVILIAAALVGAWHFYDDMTRFQAAALLRLSSIEESLKTVTATVTAVQIEQARQPQSIEKVARAKP